MEKIQMKTPLVEMDGDEMTRVLWKMIKDELICPFVDLKTEYYDLGLLHRNETRDQVTVDAALATRKYGVAVKCATITPNAQRMAEYPQLTEMWKSPNGTIRSILDGTVFRAPILLDAIRPVVRTWKKPITIARHAYGDVYKSVSFATDEPGECTMTFRGVSGKEQTVLVQKVDGPAVFQGEHNKESSIRSFAKACFQYAIDTKQDLWFSITKQQRRALLETIKCVSVPIACKAPVEDAIVTSGGVKVSEVNAKTMESKRVQGLYFAGELLDVDAYTGGFNLQIAWATGRLAGLSAAAKEFSSPEDAT